MKCTRMQYYQFKIENRLGLECRRHFQNVSILACVDRQQDCLGVGLERDIDGCRAQPWALPFQRNYALIKQAV